MVMDRNDYERRRRQRDARDNRPTEADMDYVTGAMNHYKALSIVFTWHHVGRYLCEDFKQWLDGFEDQPPDSIEIQFWCVISVTMIQKGIPEGIPKRRELVRLIRKYGGQDDTEIRRVAQQDGFKATLVEEVKKVAEIASTIGVSAR